MKSGKRHERQGSFPPWSRIPSLKEMAEELEIDHDALIQSFARDKSDQELAEQFDISSETAASLREHFMKYGIGSVMGGD
jgi:DNA-directed RNA polymerase specialized sigma subunit